MTNSSNSAFAQYAIAQHVGDPFRQEPRNIGVLVNVAGNIRIRVFGENENGDVDGRRVRGFCSPDAYRQWVRYWKDVAYTSGWESLLNASGSHYRVVRGGDVTDIGTDDASNIVDYLYSLLVSDGGFSEALGSAEEEAIRAVQFRAELKNEFAKYDLLTDRASLSRIKYPIRTDMVVQGRSKVPHRPSFVQINGKQSIIETIDFAPRSAMSLRDHAGWMAYMFNDIRSEGSNVPAETIAVVRSLHKPKDDDAAKYARALLVQESTRLVDWDDGAQRDSFLEERVKIATGDSE